MMRYLYILSFFLSFFLIVTACTKKESSSESVKEMNVHYYINNKILEREITQYSDSVKQINNRMINVNARFVADTAIYEIRYSLSAEAIYSTPSTFFVNTKSGIIAMTYEEPRISVPFAHLYGVGMSEKDAWEILKDYYPEEYQYYLRNDSTVYGIPTGGGEVWRLKFKNNEYLGKEIYWER